jgi:hypothetical protein
LDNTKGKAPKNAPVTSNPSEKYDDASSVELIALHLFCTPEFHQFNSRHPDSAPQLRLSDAWLRNIYLPGRAKEFRNDNEWLNHYLDSGYEEEIISRTTELYGNLPDHLRVRNWAATMAPEPTFTAEWNRLRINLAKYHQHREHLFELDKEYEQHRYKLMKSGSMAGTDPNSTHHLQKVYEKVYHMQNAQTECQTLLSGTVLETAITTEIDRLLSDFTERDCPELAFLGQGWLVHLPAINYIKKTLGFEPRYICKEKIVRLFTNRGKINPSSSAISPHPFFTKDTPILKSTPPSTPLEGLASSLTKQVSMVCREIDIERFKSNLQGFLNVKERLPRLIGAVNPRADAKGIKALRLQLHDESDLLHDNLFHIHKLFDKLKEEKLKTSNFGEAEHIWLRLMAIIAICFGCTSEPAFFLTTMDRLLLQFCAAVSKSNILPASVDPSE